MGQIESITKYQKPIVDEHNNVNIEAIQFNIDMLEVHSPDSLLLLNKLSCIAAEEIKFSIINKLQGEIDTCKHITILESYSMLQSVEKNKVYKMHQEVQRIVREKIGEIIENTLLQVEYIIFVNINRKRSTKEFYYHISKLLKNMDRVQLKTSYTAVLYFYMVDYLRRMGKIQEALEKLYMGKKISEEFYFCDYPNMIKCYNEIGMIYQSEEKYPEAIEMYEIVLKLYENKYIKKRLPEKPMKLVYCILKLKNYQRL